MGSNHGPTRMALAEATTPELMPRRPARGRRQPRPAPHPRARHPARAVRRRRRRRPPALAGPPAAVGLRRGTRKEAVRQAREMVDLLGHHPSIALWCAHNEPLAIDLQPGEPIRARDVRAHRRRRCSCRRGTRTCSTARSRARCTRPTRPAPVEPALGRAARPRRAAGTDTHFYFGWYHGRMDGLAPRAARGAAPRPLRHRVRRAGRPDSADFMDPERWPDLDWDELFEHHALPEAVLRPARAARAVRLVRRVARRDPALPGRAHPAAGRGPPPAQARPDRRVLPLLLRRRPSRGHLVRARPRPRAQGRVRRAPRRLPDRPADARAPRRARSTS